MKIQDQYEHACLLESMKGPKKLAQFSFIGFDPKCIIKTKNNKTTVENFDTDETIKIKTNTPLNIVKEIVGKIVPDQKLKFIGGAVGYIAYDAIRYWEKIPRIASDDLTFPDIHMGIYDDGVIFDHITGDTSYFFREKNRCQELLEIEKKSFEGEPINYSHPKTNISKEQYEQAVETTKEFIASGDIFQAVLSKRYDFNIEGDCTAFYQSLRRINPSPYMYFLKFGKEKIIGSSPEMLIRVQKNFLETFPIAGTRPRRENKTENLALTNELLSDPKERAEHVMLVDLARNDLGKVSEFGSVQVPEFMEVHQYSHVQHIVSRVIGRLKEGRNSYDVLKAVFPAGTLSGAPKVRAMEIIESLEPSRRGPYGGAVGYFSYNGNADFAITIRTLTMNNNRGHIQAGGGIVADSIAEKEWFETEYKASALMKALELTEGKL